MSDKKPPEGHAEGCDGTCGDTHDKAGVYHSLEMSVASVKKNNADAVTSLGRRVMDGMLDMMREIRDDRTIPDTSSVLTAMQVAGFRAFQMAGALDLVARASGPPTGTKLH